MGSRDVRRLTGIAALDSGDAKVRPIIEAQPRIQRFHNQVRTRRGLPLLNFRALTAKRAAAVAPAKRRAPQARARERRASSNTSRRGPPRDDDDPDPPADVRHWRGFSAASLRLHAHQARRSGTRRAVWA
jgi:hypothetical protein